MYVLFNLYNIFIKKESLLENKEINDLSLRLNVYISKQMINDIHLIYYLNFIYKMKR